MKKKLPIPLSGRSGSIVNVITRWGQVERQFVQPRDPRTPEQRAIRGTLTRLCDRWRSLTPEQRAAWRMVAADSYTISQSGGNPPRSGYTYFLGVNSCRRNIGLDEFDYPPRVPAFSENPVGELLITNTGGVITLKLRVRSLPAGHIIVQGAAPCSAGIACVQHFPFLGFLPPPIDGWSDITDLYVGRFGVPPVGKAVFICTRQHIDGWNDAPKQVRDFVRAA